MARATEMSQEKAVAVLAAAMDAWVFSRRLNEKAPGQIQGRVIKALPHVDLKVKFDTEKSSKKMTAKQWVVNAGMVKAALFGEKERLWKLSAKEKAQLAALAAFDGDSSALKALAAAGVRLDQSWPADGKDRDDRSLHMPPLLIATLWLRDGALRMLLALGCDPNIQSAGDYENPVSALCLAATAGYGARAAASALAIVKDLVEHGADVNFCEKKNKNTPLHWAALSGRAEIAKTLVENGANWLAANRNKNTALSIAKKVSMDASLQRSWQERNGFVKQSQVGAAMAQFVALDPVFESQELARVVAETDNRAGKEKTSVNEGNEAAPLGQLLRREARRI